MLHFGMFGSIAPWHSETHLFESVMVVLEGEKVVLVQSVKSLKEVKYFEFYSGSGQNSIIREHVNCNIKFEFIRIYNSLTVRLELQLKLFSV